jgi:DNA-binding GntR family transcriptional regulator
VSIRALAPVGRPVALGDQVYRALRELLRSGDLAAGQPLQELPLAAQLGVSRTPVREALARLASEGLLAIDGRSFTVPALTRTDVEDIYELRCLIEPAAMRRVAPLAAEAAARAALDAALADAARAHRRGDSDAFRAAHVAHRAAWLALVPNQRMVHMIELYAEHLQHIRALTLGNAAVRTIVLDGLGRITAALAAGDGDAAAAAMHAHLLQARLAFLKALGLEAQGRSDAAAGRASPRARANGPTTVRAHPAQPA